MQGYSHALTGAAGWLAVTSSVSIPVPDSSPLLAGTDLPLAANLIGATPEVALAGAIVCAGAALVPDMDHHSGTIAHSLPPLTNIACAGVETISGGHRHGTHSFLGVLAFTVLAWIASFFTVTIEGRTVAIGAGLIVVPLVAFAMKALRIRLGRRGSVLNTSLGPWIVSLGTAGAATYFLDERWTWLPIAVGLGALIHCLGDALTVQGVPWLWPWNPAPPKKLLSLPVVGSAAKATWQTNGYFRFAVLGETTSAREAIFAGILALYVIATLMMVVAGMAGT